jgi:phosphoribosyl-ATP pyrophosphohydrolase
LKLEPTILVCYGPCGQRIKKQGTYFISGDGAVLWCQKCYTAANSVIVDSYEDDHSPLLKKDLLKRKFDEEAVETWIECSTCSRKIHQVTLNSFVFLVFLTFVGLCFVQRTS